VRAALDEVEPRGPHVEPARDGPGLPRLGGARGVGRIRAPRRGPRRRRGGEAAGSGQAARGGGDAARPPARPRGTAVEAPDRRQGIPSRPDPPASPTTWTTDVTQT